MRALRFGSYSIDATLAGIPSLLRRKSMIRYCCLCPPPRWRDVLRPWLLRPPLCGFGASSDFSGRSRVISEKSETVWKRRPGLVGLRERSGMVMFRSALEQVDGVVGVERHDGALGVGALAPHVGAPVAGRLPLAIQRVDVGDADTEGLLDGVGHLDLGGARVDDEGVDVLLHQRVALLGDHRTDEHGHGVTHRCRPPWPSWTPAPSGPAPSWPARRRPRSRQRRHRGPRPRAPLYRTRRRRRQRWPRPSPTWSPWLPSWREQPSRPWPPGRRRSRAWPASASSAPAVPPAGACPRSQRATSARCARRRRSSRPGPR